MGEVKRWAPRLLENVAGEPYMASMMEAPRSGGYVRADDVLLKPKADVDRLVKAAKAVDQYDFAFGLEHGQLGEDELTAIAELSEALAAMEND